MIESDSLDTRIFFYRLKEDAPKNRIAPELDFDIFRGCWADVRAITAREQIRNGLEIQDQTYTIRCRYFSGLNTSNCRIKFNNAWYLITSIQINRRERELIVSVSYDARLNKNEGITT